jgi:hypothetical protein
LQKNKGWSFRGSISVSTAKIGIESDCYDGKLEIDNWKGARYSVDFNTGQASFMFSGKN